MFLYLLIKAWRRIQKKQRNCTITMVKEMLTSRTEENVKRIQVGINHNIIYVNLEFVISEIKH